MYVWTFIVNKLKSTDAARAKEGGMYVWHYVPRQV